MYFTLAMVISAMAALGTAESRHAGRGTGIAIPLTKHGHEFVNVDKSVDFIALKSHITCVEANIRQGFSNFERNTGSPHPSAVNGHRKRQSVSLTDFSNTLWYGPISVGVPAQTLTVAFATGSSDLILPSFYCDASCDGHVHYNQYASSVAQDLNMTFNLTFNDGSQTSGEQWSDTVTIAGSTATSQTLGGSLTYSSALKISTFPADGIMGMGFQSISYFGASPVFQTLIAEGQVPYSVFSLQLSSTGGELYIGGDNSALYSGDFTWCTVTQEGYWQIYMDHIDGNGNTLMSDIDVIFDTGTTAIIGIASDVSQLHENLGGSAVSGHSGFYSFPCSSFPTVTFFFDSTTGFAIPSSALNLGPISSGSSDCLSGIVASQDQSASFWIIGDIFLRGVYTQFDVGNGVIGFATLA